MCSVPRVSVVSVGAVCYWHVGVSLRGQSKGSIAQMVCTLTFYFLVFRGLRLPTVHILEGH